MPMKLPPKALAQYTHTLVRMMRIRLKLLSTPKRGQAAHDLTVQARHLIQGRRYANPSQLLTRPLPKYLRKRIKATPATKSLLATTLSSLSTRHQLLAHPHYLQNKMNLVSPQTSQSLTPRTRSHG